jgi:hypothetical protein
MHFYHTLKCLKFFNIYIYASRLFNFHFGSKRNSVHSAFFPCHAVPNVVRPFYRGHDHGSLIA